MTEHEAARAWREQLGLTRERLSELTGYSTGSIQCMEAGFTSQRKPVAAGPWKRYKVACLCAAIMLATGEQYSADNWTWHVAS